MKDSKKSTKKDTTEAKAPKTPVPKKSTSDTVTPKSTTPVKIPKAPPSATPVDMVAAAYRAAKYTVIVTAGAYDIIAQGSQKQIHFVQVRTRQMIDDYPLRYTGLQMNSFVQNAFSNNAQPIYATVDGSNIEYKNVNTWGVISLNPSRSV